MNSIQNQSSTLAATLASLAAQTQQTDDAFTAALSTNPDQATSSAGSDVLQLSSSASDPNLSAAAQQIAEQNSLSTLADSSAALTANNAAAAALQNASANALSSQANLSPSTVLSLVTEN